MDKSPTVAVGLVIEMKLGPSRSPIAPKKEGAISRIFLLVRTPVAPRTMGSSIRPYGGDEPGFERFGFRSAGGRGAAAGFPAR